MITGGEFLDDSLMRWLRFFCQEIPQKQVEQCKTLVVFRDIWDEQLIDLTCHSHIFSISGNPCFFRISWVSGFVSRDCVPWLHLQILG